MPRHKIVEDVVVALALRLPTTRDFSVLPGRCAEHAAFLAERDLDKLAEAGQLLFPNVFALPNASGPARRGRAAMRERAGEGRG